MTHLTNTSKAAHQSKMSSSGSTYIPWNKVRAHVPQGIEVPMCFYGSLCKLMESKVLGDDFGMRFFMCENYKYDPPKRRGKDRPKARRRGALEGGGAGNCGGGACFGRRLRTNQHLKAGRLPPDLAEGLWTRGADSLPPDEPAVGPRPTAARLAHLLSPVDPAVGAFRPMSWRLAHDRGQVSSASCVGPQHGSHGACDGSSLKPTGDCCLFASSSTRSSSQVALSRRASKGVSSSFHLNRHLHHANPHDKLSAPFTRVAKSWVPKSMLANPSGSKTRACLSSHV
ncbi:hypothetical protein C2845_PM15G04990 [Panicum miliaceum]|uniref:Uncharacterized protein n=1 Tax=Panicum miliaceum TaxID=4540 RepID=A0A3L6Q7D5_PANMI|nr:hypothetical protein C2845_PM15G04990 [Panicum miliaceum]